MKYKLSELIECQNGFAFNSKCFSSAGKYYVVRIKEIKNGFVKITNDTVKITPEESFDGNKYLLTKGDVVFALTGDPVSRPNPGSWVGRIALYNNDVNSLLNQRLCKVICNENINPLFLYYYFTLFENFYALASKATGSANQANISVNTIKETIVDFPEKIVQDKIVSILQYLDKKIELNNKINDNLSRQMSLIINEYVSTLNDYKIKLLSQVADLQNGYAFYKDGYDNNGAFVVDLGNVNINATFIKTASDKYISLERYNNPKLEKFRLYKDDLIMVMTDRKSSMDLLGKTGKIIRDGKYLLNQRMYRIRAKKGINVSYLYSVLNSSEVSNYLKSKALGSVQKYINTGVINDIKIKIPSPNEMEKLSLIVDPIMIQIENNIFENETLTQLRDTLLPKLMAGEIDVSNIKIDL